MSDIDIIGSFSAEPTITGQLETTLVIQGNVDSQFPAQVSVVSTTTGDPGTDASVVNAGTPGNARLKFTIPRGATGAQGNTGPQGEQGLQGNQGEQGEKGDTGDTGATGPANTLTIGTVEDGATADATITGTAPNQTLNLTLPKGDKGDKGDQGDPGTAGADGADGVVQSLVAGSNITIDATDPQNPIISASGGSGLPTGGTTGQVLAKASDADDDTEWVDQEGIVTLSAPLTIYVRDDGDDTNPGTSDTSGGALLTFAKAIEKAYQVNTNGHSVAIQANDASRSENVFVGGPLLGGGILAIQGNTSTPSNCPLAVSTGDCFTITNHASVSIRGFKMSAAAGRAIYFDSGSQVIHGNNDFGDCLSSHLSGGLGGIAIGLYDYTISGDAESHWHTGVPSSIDNINITITLTGTPNFTAYFAGSAGGYIRFLSVTFSGSATGKRFYVHKNGTIDAMGAGLTALPGDVAGEWHTGGKYIGSSSTVTFRETTAFSVPVSVQQSEDGSGAGPFLLIDRESASPANNDAIGAILFQGRNSSGSTSQYTQINSYVQNVTAGSETAVLRFNTRRSNTPLDRMSLGDGLYMAGATGGDKGAGTINATAVYDDNVLLTDLVLDFAVEGHFDLARYADHPIADQMRAWWLDPRSYADFWKKNRHLPSIPSWEKGEAPATGEMITRLVATVEAQAVHIERLLTRIEALEKPD